MEVILIKDVEKLGYTDETVNVKPGYALNYLLPEGYAVANNSTNQRLLAERLKVAEKKEAKLVAQIGDVKARLEGVKLTIEAKAGTSGKIFGSVTGYHVADAIRKTANIEVDRKKITIVEGEVKTLGDYTAEVGLGKEHKVTVAFEVVAG
jgi:large subunit ribosomal protein L9